MIGHLYRYPHPVDSTRFIYVGQGKNRDVAHRAARTSFGRRFKRGFPGAGLPQPIKETVEVQNQLELNELETIWMFQYHTWCGYEGGMNLTFPNSANYSNMSAMGNLPGARVKAGKISGQKHVESGHIIKLGNIYGPIRGKQNSESGQIKALGLAFGSINGRKAAENGQLAAARKIGCRVKSENKRKSCIANFALASHTRWHVHRNVISPTCSLCQVSQGKDGRPESSISDERIGPARES